MTLSNLLYTDCQLSRKRLANLFLILALGFGVIMILLEPPFSGPDEQVHFFNICRITHGHLFASVENGQIGSYLSGEELAYYNLYYGIKSEAGIYGFDVMSQLWRTPMDETLVFVPSTMFTVNSLPYLVPAIPVILLRFLGIPVNAFATMLIGKLANLLLYAFLIRFAIIKTGLFPKTMFLLALMPMALYQGASLSYDALTLSSCALLFAYATKLLVSPEEYRIKREDVIALGVAAACIAGAKIAYVFLLGVLFSIPIKKFGSFKRYFACIGCVVGAIAACYLLPTLIKNGINAGFDPPPTAAFIAQREYLLSHPLEFPKIIFNTVYQFFPLWSSGFVGYLGWFDIPFPGFSIYLYFALLLISAVLEGGCVKNTKWHTRLFTLGASAAIILGIITIMFLEHNPIIAQDPLVVTMALGVQGRYFIPLSLFVCLGCTSPLLLRFKHHEKANQIFAHIMPLCSAAYLVLTVVLLKGYYWA